MFEVANVTPETGVTVQTIDIQFDDPATTTVASDEVKARIYTGTFTRQGSEVRREASVGVQLTAVTQPTTVTCDQNVHGRLREVTVNNKTYIVVLRP
jgi:hypothetical protein